MNLLYNSYRFHAFLLSAAVALSILAPWGGAHAAQPVPGAGSKLVPSLRATGCTAQGECRLDISGMSQVVDRACGVEQVWLSWNTRYPQVSMVTCDCVCTSHDNTGWIVDQDAAGGHVHPVALGKPAWIETLEPATNQVADIIASHPWCDPAGLDVPERAIFVTLVKHPTGSDQTPYCFTPEFFVAGNNGVVETVGGSFDGVVSGQDRALDGIGRDVQRIREQWDALQRD